ncbi:FAS1-like dehydratase domain-containing protein [Paraburkholderia sp. HP33-1]|uniref:FAS1-like dehydratase domain-containing protein n=1 Tax=Paraburkholderia sp. HP33-1 TaxID=2883243 RepID=UPI001F2F68E9|nr:MaoC family dehydratase N-terminal domain-containing protein [Paraburkholderia sp. HP33-1]
MADASLIGYRFPSFSFPVEEGKLREFSRAVLWEGGARPAPTFSAAASFWTPPDTGPGLNLDLKRVLAGGNEWEYLGLIAAGDVLTVHASITDVRHKAGKRGVMSIIVREARFVNQRGEEVLVQRSDIIELPPRNTADESAKEGV